MNLEILLGVLSPLTLVAKEIALREGAKVLAKALHDGNLSDAELAEWHAVTAKAQREARLQELES